MKTWTVILLDSDMADERRGVRQVSGEDWIGGRIRGV